MADWDKTFWKLVWSNKYGSNMHPRKSSFCTKMIVSTNIILLSSTQPVHHHDPGLPKV